MSKEEDEEQTERGECIMPTHTNIDIKIIIPPSWNKAYLKKNVNLSRTFRKTIKNHNII
jgi:hypothetical protein